MENVIGMFESLTLEVMATVVVADMAAKAKAMVVVVINMMLRKLIELTPLISFTNSPWLNGKSFALMVAENFVVSVAMSMVEEMKSLVDRDNRYLKPVVLILHQVLSVL